MESKYYTPSIDEFHVGFEFESVEGIKFKLKSINELQAFIHINAFTTNSYDGEYSINLDLYYVKYLDKEDIESLGFVCTENNEGEVFYYKFEKKDLLFGVIEIEFFNWFSGDVPLVSKKITEHTKLKIKVKGGHTLFNGTIKNKSELKVLLKQLGL